MIAGQNVLIERTCQLAAWLLLLGIIVLSLVPPSLRPVTYASHGLEHLAIFLATGFAFAIGYPKRRSLQMIALPAFAGAIEIAQVWAPGRHPRFSDFLTDAAAACIGVGVPLIFAKSRAILWSMVS